MRLSRILLALAVTALLASNGFLIYQNTRVKTKVDKLQTDVTSLETQVKAVNSNVTNTDRHVQDNGSAISSFCDNFTTFTCQ